MVALCQKQTHALKQMRSVRTSAIHPPSRAIVQTVSDLTASLPYNESAEKVLQSEILPELKPFKNQRLRCAEVPWVKASGTI
jgi:hypothetical protein